MTDLFEEKNVKQGKKQKSNRLVSCNQNMHVDVAAFEPAFGLWINFSALRRLKSWLLG
jgi:hypothetical protein